MRKYHIAKWGSDSGEGTKDNPFLTIGKGAATAESGDCVIVHEGEYREWVKPMQGGRSDIERITYEAAKNEKVVIKGSERITNWIWKEGDVWKVILPNDFFGNYNPYKEVLGGDWFIYPADNSLHLGEVYMNGKAFYEAKNLEEVMNPVPRKQGENPPWMGSKAKILYPEDTVYQWYCQVDDNYTTIYGNFQGKNPNKELVEINVRKCCFYPEKTGLNYITVKGFEFAQAACPWAPPTAEQPGMVGPNWSKGWVIENNILHDGKCSGISIGKEDSTGDNLCTKLHRKPGYQYQMEAVFLGRQIGWTKERIGSHNIRNNVIYDCGQNGIVGHMGCAFSVIEHNQIYRIGTKQEFFGYEIAGIKLHGAIDVQIIHNNIHDCSLGTWLDWQAQGARISRNIYYHNERDLMMEVTHGPYMVDNNIFASAYNFDNVAQGGAYLHNLCCGTMRKVVVMDRATPYHFSHTTEVAGVALVYGGDDRVFQNIYVGGAPIYSSESKSGTGWYCGHPASMDEYAQNVAAMGNEDHEQFEKVRQPVYIDGNVYLNGAATCDREANFYQSNHDPNVCILVEEDRVYLEMDVEDAILQMQEKIYESKDLGMPRITELPYVNPDGSMIRFDQDYLGNKRGEHPMAGPFQTLKKGLNRIRVW